MDFVIFADQTVPHLVSPFDTYRYTLLMNPQTKLTCPLESCDLLKVKNQSE